VQVFTPEDTALCIVMHGLYVLCTVGLEKQRQLNLILSYISFLLTVNKSCITPLLVSA